MATSSKRSKLVVGALAPDFMVTDALGASVGLRSFQEKYLLVVFMRYSACPWCNLTIHRLAMEYPILHDNGCEVVVFMQSTAEKIKKNIYDMHNVRPQFSIVPDVTKKYYKLYGAHSSLPKALTSIKDIPYWLHAVAEHGLKRPEISADLLLVPALFLISPGEQKVLHAEYGSSFYDNQTFTALYESLIFGNRV